MFSWSANNKRSGKKKEKDLLKTQINQWITGKLLQKLWHSLWHDAYLIRAQIAHVIRCCLLFGS